MSAVARSSIVYLSQKLVKTRLFQPLSCRVTQQSWFHNSIRLLVAGQEVKMPSLSPTMTEGTIVKWLKKEGDPIAAGDVLCDIQTDKAVLSLECDDEGILAKILIPEDTKDVKVGTLIALTVSEGEDWKSVEIPAGTSSQPESSDGTAAKPSGEKVSHTATPQSLGPAVRTLLDKYGLKATEVKGSGPHGNLVKGDILQYVQEKGLQPKAPTQVPPPASSMKPSQATAAAPGSKAAVKTPGATYTDIELSNMRKVIAKRLTQSKTSIPHAYGSVDSVMDNIIAVRKSLKGEGVDVSLNDFIIKAVAVALQHCPEVNAVWKGDQVTLPSDIDISVAVATDAGLITPIVKGVLGKGVERISAEIRELAGRARQGKLQPHEFQGGTFTISNLGMFGIREFSAIINPPQCGILAVGGGRKVLDGNGKTITKMVATLSYDRRAIPEEVAADFLDVFRQALENPSLLMVGDYKIRTHLAG